jgi:hypothetical protein
MEERCTEFGSPMRRGPSVHAGSYGGESEVGYRLSAIGYQLSHDPDSSPLDQPPAHPHGRRLGAGVDAKLDEEVGHVGLHRARADEERFADLAI